MLNTDAADERITCENCQALDRWLTGVTTRCPNGEVLTMSVCRFCYFKLGGPEQLRTRR